MLTTEPLASTNGILSYIGAADQSAFYEHDYLQLHPDLHRSDSESKSLDAIQALQSIPPEELEHISIICDIGSGSGIVMQRVTEWLNSKIRKQRSLVSVDISLSILKKISIASPKVTKIQADAAQLPLKDKSVDLVLLIDIVEHTEHPQAVIDEALRVGTYCIIKAPIERSLYTHLNGGASRLKKMEDKFGHIQHFSLNDFKRLTKGKQVLYEEYDIIPNRAPIIDALQKFLIHHRLNWLYGNIFGGFKVCLLKT